MTTGPFGTAALSAQLRDGTRALHEAAERTPFVRRCLEGEISRGSWLSLLEHLEPMYAALEAGLHARRAEAPFSAFAAPELRRAPLIAADRTALGGRQHDLPPLARELEERIRTVARTDPPRLIGHAYARYFGDLMGGRILRRAAERSPELGGAGTRFLVFDITRPALYVSSLREAMDAADWSASIEARVVDEGRRAFAWSIAVFERIERHRASLHGPS